MKSNRGKGFFLVAIMNRERDRRSTVAHWRCGFSRNLTNGIVEKSIKDVRTYAETMDAQKNGIQELNSKGMICNRKISPLTEGRELDDGGLEPVAKGCQKE